MEEARAMLDALMGPSRNQNQLSKESDSPDFADDKVCKNFLVGFCPHDWFTASRRKLPTCSKIHSDVLRETFESHPDMAKYRRRFEEQFLQYLEGVTRECDLFIGREKIKCRPKGCGGVTTRMPADVQEKYESLQKQHEGLVKQAEEQADESLSRSQELTRQAVDVEQELAEYRKRYRFEFPGEEVCDVCGVRYALQADDNPDWHERASHLNGKMHHGWLQIRQKLKELKEKERVWEREDYRENNKSRKRQAKDRNMDRPKEHRRGKDPEKDRRDLQKTRKRSKRRKSRSSHSRKPPKREEKSGSDSAGHLKRKQKKTHADKKTRKTKCRQSSSS
mmetsp:Transcript_18617/g.34939  ORF Transcript_18617/g.34939 Transcript_18617/m.34939 type:complete len:335 (+) Transcript_18617:69-1073(+)